MREQRFLVLLLILSMVVWGVSWSSAKVMSNYGDALSIAYIRFVLVVISLLPVLYFSRLGFKVPSSSIPYFIIAGFFLGTYSLSFFSGLKLGHAGSGGVIVTVLNPIFTFVIGSVMSKSFPSKFEFLGLLVGAIAGSILLHLWGDDGWSYLIDGGNYFFVLGALLWALLSKVSSRAREFGHPFVFNFWLHVVVVFFFSFLVDWSTLEGIWEKADSVFWLNMFYFSTINSTLATGCYLYATSVLGAERASSYIFIVPLGAVLSTWFFLGEKLEWDTIFGGTMGLIAVYLINRRSLRKVPE